MGLSGSQQIVMLTVHHTVCQFDTQTYTIFYCNEYILNKKVRRLILKVLLWTHFKICKIICYD